jgi:carbon storage regulator
MLYITRKKGESIIVNNEIEIKIVEVHGNKVKLGCIFPSNSSILRSELHQKILESNRSSVSEALSVEDLEGLK